jgi:hypothetical protein
MVMLDMTSGRLSPAGIRNCKISNGIKPQFEVWFREESHWLNVFHGELLFSSYLPIGHHRFVARMIA